MAWRALIVDDSEFARRRLRQILRAAEFEVVGEAVHGGAAIQLYQQLRPDVVTMDLNIPGLDGLTATRAILKCDPQARILVVSTRADEHSVIEARRLGARGFVAKPYETGRLLAALRALVALPAAPESAARAAAPSAGAPAADATAAELGTLFREEADLQLRTAAEAVQALGTNPLDARALDDLYRAAHTLHGTASLAGRADVALLAASVEQTAQLLRKTGAIVTPEQLGLLNEALATLGRLLDAPTTAPPAGVQELARQLEPPGEPAMAPAVPPSGLAPPAPQRTRVLVVDDDSFTRRVLVSFLNREGYSVRLAEDGEEALQSAFLNPPDLILLDIELPRVWGVEVCEQLRDDARTRQVPILVLSVRDELNAKLEAFAAGADDYVTKPFEPEEVLARIRVLLARAGAGVGCLIER